MLAGDVQATDTIRLPRLATLFGIRRRPVKAGLASESTAGLGSVPGWDSSVRSVNQQDAITILNARRMRERWGVAHARSILLALLDEMSRLIDPMHAALQSAGLEVGACHESKVLFHDPRIMVADNPQMLRSSTAFHRHNVTVRHDGKRNGSSAGMIIGAGRVPAPISVG